MWIADVMVRDATDMDQRRLGDPNIDERTKIHNIQHGPSEFHSRLDVVDFDDPRAKRRCRQIVSWVASRLRKRVQDVSQRQLANAEFSGQFGEIQR